MFESLALHLFHKMECEMKKKKHLNLIEKAWYDIDDALYLTIVYLQSTLSNRWQTKH